ncbi:T-cell-specific guanine nucleotide triphosphate-binding protein 2-like [Mya arenaria]|uniref:T-cell-specific guanine nucleotide triphosphate-binding protein 2-like n=1 Tax=Mya arenaria TaxID=6604 RepID=UPI0022E58686|nr:T-cell-specific guanine nucleotide triphosphate-binding protein 2-like [Mya arenaria]
MESYQISDTETEEYKRILKETGYTALCEKLEEPINGWKKVQINIAVTGEPGTGKSSFINSIRGLKADDPGAAEVSLFETTMNLSGYPHPDNPNLRIWDLPYVGTLTFTRDNYLQKAALSQFDFFLLLSASRFKENDIWLAKEFLKLKPNFHFFFVRTKIDDDLRSSQKGRRKLQTAEDMHALQQEIKEWARLNLVKHGISNANIYLVDNYDTAAFDFGTMYSKLMQNVSRLEREAMIMATKEVVQTKLAFLKSRISLVSQTAAEAAVFATAVTNKYPAEIYVLLEECRLYRSQLGLNLNSLEIIAKRFEIDFEELLVNLSMTSYIYVDCEDGFANFYTRFGIIEPKIWHSLPLIGNMLKVKAHQKEGAFILKEFLDMCAKETHDLQMYMAKALEGSEF